MIPGYCGGSVLQWLLRCWTGVGTSATGLPRVGVYLRTLQMGLGRLRFDVVGADDE